LTNGGYFSWGAVVCPASRMAKSKIKKIIPVLIAMFF
jgi:hypothetical protein